MVLHVELILVVLLYVFVADILELFWRENSHKVPGLVQTVIDGPHIILSLCDEVVFKSLQKLQVKKVVLIESLFSNNSLHGKSVLTHCIVKIQLIGYLLMVCSCSTLSNGTLH